VPDAGVGVNHRRVCNPPQFDFTKSNLPGWVMNNTYSLADTHLLTRTALPLPVSGNFISVTGPSTEVAVV
jgi:hypothetical protein